MTRNPEHPPDVFSVVKKDLAPTVLDRALDGLRQDETSVELEPLLRAAHEFRQATSVGLAPGTRAAHLSLIAKKAREISLAQKPRRPRRWGLRPAFALGAAFMLVLPAAAAFASDDLPDEPLYGLKLAAENLRLLIETEGREDDRLHLEFAAKRLEEIATMRDEGRARGLGHALQNLEDHLASVSEGVEAGGDPELESLIEEVRDQHMVVLGGLIEDAGCDPQNPSDGAPQCRGLLNAYENSSKHLDQIPDGKPEDAGPPSDPGSSSEENKGPEDPGNSGHERPGGAGNSQGDDAPPQERGSGEAPPSTPRP